MKKVGWPVVILATWTVCGLLLAALERPLVEVLWLGAGLVYLAYALIGLCLAVVIFAFGVSEKNVPACLVALLFLVVGPTLWFAEPDLAEWGTIQVRRYRVWRDLPRYEKIVQKMTEFRPSEPAGEEDGIRYRVDSDSPLRVAFPQPGGLLDNWEGVVYDPTGEVQKAQGWTEVNGQQAFTAPDHVRRLFGGSIVSCVHIHRDYYRCWFT